MWEMHLPVSHERRRWRWNAMRELMRISLHVLSHDMRWWRWKVSMMRMVEWMRLSMWKVH